MMSLNCCTNCPPQHPPFIHEKTKAQNNLSEVAQLVRGKPGFKPRPCRARIQTQALQPPSGLLTTMLQSTSWKQTPKKSTEFMHAKTLATKMYVCNTPVIKHLHKEKESNGTELGV